MKTRYKFLRTGYKSEIGDHKWKVGKWYEYDGDIEMCKSGFHCSKGIYQAFSHIRGEILAEVEVAGKHEVQDDKEVWEKMRVVRSWKWTKKDSVLFAIFAARLVLKNFEKEFPCDDRPRKAIEAAEVYAKNPTEKNREAAESAAWAAESAAWAAESVTESAWATAWVTAKSAAEAAWAARSAAEAAWAARSTARSATRSTAWAAAWAATRSAAWATESAARAAESTARAAESVTEPAAEAVAARAAKSAIYKKLDKWMLDHLPELKLLQDKLVL